ncbi:MAG: type 1 glutamine amidotransferase domain-containing protein [Kordiimonas sp.]
MLKKLLFVLCALSISSLSSTWADDRKSNKVLFLLSTHHYGYWVPEVMEPYDSLTKNGYEVVFASAQGAPGYPNAVTRLNDELAKAYEALLASGDISRPMKLVDVQVSDYAAVFVPGGWGPVFDLPNHPQVQRVLSEFYVQEKIVSAVCHGPAAFIGVKLPNGNPLIAGHEVTGKSNAEEGKWALKRFPYLIEDTFKKQGAVYSAAKPQKPYVVHDGFLLTGQNPASAKPLGDKLVEILDKRAS